MMTRNTEKKWRSLRPSKILKLKRELFDYLKLQFADNVKARIMKKRGLYFKKTRC